MYIFVDWLNANPWGWLALGLIVLALFIAWVARPVTWQDGESPVRNEEDRIGWGMFWRWFP